MKDSLIKVLKMGRNVRTLTAGTHIYRRAERVFAQNRNLTDSWGSVPESPGIFWHCGFLEAGETVLHKTGRGVNLGGSVS